MQYGTHVAAAGGDPDPAIRDELSAHYSEEKANDIDLIVRAIMFGNLSGNTHDAFWARLAGRPAPGSRVGFEAAFALVTAPLFLLGRCRHRRERRALARATS